MSNGNNNNNINNNKNNNKLNELSAFLSTNSSILESQQQQNAMFGVGNVGSLTLVQQSQNQNASSSMPLFIGKNGKPTRPFKAYPKESLSIPIVGSGNSSASATISELISNGNSNNINNNNASSNNQKVILSANINALAHLLSQQHQMGTNSFG